MGPWQFSHTHGVIANRSLCPVLEHDDSSSSSRLNSLRLCFLSESASPGLWSSWKDRQAGLVPVLAASCRPAGLAAFALFGTAMCFFCSGRWGHCTAAGPTTASQDCPANPTNTRAHGTCPAFGCDASHSTTARLTCRSQSPTWIFLLACLGLSLMPLWHYPCPWFPFFPSWMDVVLVLSPPHPIPCGRGIQAPWPCLLWYPWGKESCDP